MRGLGYPKPPRLNKEAAATGGDSTFEAQWFVDTIKDKIATHPDRNRF